MCRNVRCSNNPGVLYTDDAIPKSSLGLPEEEETPDEDPKEDDMQVDSDGDGDVDGDSEGDGDDDEGNTDVGLDDEVEGKIVCDT